MSRHTLSLMTHIVVDGKGHLSQPASMISSLGRKSLSCRDSFATSSHTITCFENVILSVLNIRPHNFLFVVMPGWVGGRSFINVPHLLSCCSWGFAPHVPDFRNVREFLSFVVNILQVRVMHYPAWLMFIIVAFWRDCIFCMHNISSTCWCLCDHKPRTSVHSTIYDIDFGKHLIYDATCGIWDQETRSLFSRWISCSLPLVRLLICLKFSCWAHLSRAGH